MATFQNVSKKCELVGVDICEAMRDIGGLVGGTPGYNALIFDEGGTGRCVLTQQTHGYACGHCGTRLAIHSNGHIVERV